MMSMHFGWNYVDPGLVEHGRSRLEGKLRDLSTALGFVHYALCFGALN